MKRSGYIIFLLLLAISVYSQKSIDVEKIKGECVIAGDVSPNMAKERALNDAKVNALKAAGIDETVNSYQLLFTSQAKNDYSQFFSSDIQSEMQGAVKSVKVLSEKIYCSNDNRIICEVIINAVVVKYTTKADAGFKSNIDGIKGVYNHGDNLTFNLKVTQNCYLTIFNITDSEAGVLFPNEYEKENALKKQDVYNFPMAKIDYSLGNNSKNQEINRLIFVFTKKEIPFIKMNREQNTTSETIFNWIYSIPPDERYMEYFTLSINK